MEYWYLWLLLIVLCVITVFVLSKASAAAKKHNNERDALLREYDRKKALKEEFSFLTREKAESSDPETLFEGVSAVLQAKTEKAEDPEKVFGKFTETQKYIYTLYYFLEDTESDSLSFFFRNNGEPLTSLASKALCAVGENELSLIVEKEFSMYDENNEEVSVDKDEIENLDGEFKAKLQKQQVLSICCLKKGREAHPRLFSAANSAALLRISFSECSTTVFTHFGSAIFFCDS